jgi:hypothetical protein
MTNFDPFLIVIGDQLGLNYELYAKGLRKIKAQLYAMETLSPGWWRMNQLVEGVPAFVFSHCGVLSLFRIRRQ